MFLSPALSIAIIHNRDQALAMSGERNVVVSGKFANMFLAVPGTAKHVGGQGVHSHLVG